MSADVRTIKVQVRPDRAPSCLICSGRLSGNNASLTCQECPSIPRWSGDLKWQRDALCAQTDPEAFFPQKGGSTREAKRTCAACPVLTRCRDWALSPSGPEGGYLGGMSAHERQDARRAA